jgi:hypothetical protein
MVKFFAKVIFLKKGFRNRDSQIEHFTYCFHGFGSPGFNKNVGYGMGEW